LSLTENVLVVDSFASSAQLIQSLAENLAVSDAAASFINTIIISLSENIGIGDDISEIMLDIHLVLTEQLAIVYSFFTPQLAYHNDLANEGLGLSDTLEIEAEQTLLLNETLRVSDSTASSIVGGDEGQGNEEQGGGKGGSRDHITKMIDESLGVGIDMSAQTNNAEKNETNLALSETLSLYVNSSISAGVPEAPVHNITGTLDSVTTSLQLFPPSATGSISIHFVTSAKDLEDVIMVYSVIDEESGATILTWSKHVAISNGTVSESIQLPFTAPGDYNLVVNVKDNDKVLATTVTNIPVTWLDVYAYLALVTAALITEAGTVALTLLKKNRTRKARN
jgi:hypothetical protein